MERLAHLAIEQHRILARLLGKHPFGEARNEHYRECAAPRLVGTADEYPAVAMHRRVLVQRAQPFGKHVAASSSVTGPMAAIGRSSFSTRRTRAGFRSTSGDSASNRFNHSPHVPVAGHVASASMTGSANARRCRRFLALRRRRSSRGDSGSSRASSLIWR